MRKQALLYRNKVFLKRVYIKRNMSELYYLIYDAFDVKITLEVCENWRT